MNAVKMMQFEGTYTDERPDIVYSGCSVYVPIGQCCRVGKGIDSEQVLQFQKWMDGWMDWRMDGTPLEH